MPRRAAEKPWQTRASLSGAATLAYAIVGTFHGSAQVRRICHGPVAPSAHTVTVCADARVHSHVAGIIHRVGIGWTSGTRRSSFIRTQAVSIIVDCTRAADRAVLILLAYRLVADTGVDCGTTRVKRFTGVIRDRQPPLQAC